MTMSTFNKLENIYIVPEGWEHKALGKIFEFKNGLNTEKEQYGDGYKFVNVMDVFRNNVLTESKIIGRVQVSDKQLKEYRLKFGDVLFNRTSETYAEIAMSAVYMDSEIATFGGFVIRGRPIDDSIHPNYSVYAFQSSDFRTQTIKLGQGAVRANIGQKDLSKVVLLLPPIIEQMKIAQILSTWDNAIATTEKLLENSQKQKQALMQQLLTGKKRFSGFSRNWNTYILEELEELGWLELGRGNVISKTDIENNPGENPIYSSSVKNQGLMGTYADWMFDEELISWSVDGGGNFFYRHKHKFSITNVSGWMRVDTSKLNYKFMANQLSYLHGKLKFDYQSKAHPSVIRKLYKLNIPTLLEQEKIASILGAAESEVTSLEVKIKLLKEEKRALMQQLLTGKKRVKLEG